MPNIQKKKGKAVDPESRIAEVTERLRQGTVAAISNTELDALVERAKLRYVAIHEELKSLRVKAVALTKEGRELAIGLRLSAINPADLLPESKDDDDEDDEDDDEDEDEEDLEDDE